MNVIKKFSSFCIYFRHTHTNKGRQTDEQIIRLGSIHKIESLQQLSTKYYEFK